MDKPVHIHASLTTSNPEQKNAGISADKLASFQIKAFLAAAEEVDVDRETLLDILDTETGEGIDPVSINEEEDDPELDISALYTAEEEGRETWSKQDIRWMLHHLKEKGMASFVKEYVGNRGHSIPKLLLAFGINLCPELCKKRESTLLYFLRVAMSRELQLREKLPEYNTVDDAVSLIQTSNRILILTGAGISVSCGIPDFRSREGLYASLKENPRFELDDPQQMFDIGYFKENPEVFYAFAKRIYPSNFIPSPCHRFIKAVEDKGKLLRNYTQNIDTLETLAGVKNVLNCHGSFATATCLQCHQRAPGNVIEVSILSQTVPLCKTCSQAASKSPSKPKKKKVKSGWASDDDDESDEPTYPPYIMKPDITFFGEKLDDAFDKAMLSDREEVDLILVIGTSLKVAPVADLLAHMPHSVPQILINKTPVRHINPDIVLLGNADDIVEHISASLHWPIPAFDLNKVESNNALKRSVSAGLEPQSRVGDTHIWLFNGAEGGKWLKDIEQAMGLLDESGLEMTKKDLDNEQRLLKKARVS